MLWSGDRHQRNIAMQSTGRGSLGLSFSDANGLDKTQRGYPNRGDKAGETGKVAYFDHLSFNTQTRYRRKFVYIRVAATKNCSETSPWLYPSYKMPPLGLLIDVCIIVVNRHESSVSLRLMLSVLQMKCFTDEPVSWSSTRRPDWIQRSRHLCHRKEYNIDSM